MNMPYYAVANGKKIGVFLHWNECNDSVKGFKNAVFKKFDTNEQAEKFIETNKPQHHTNQYITNEIIPDYYVYTDGSCTNNGKENAKAGIGVFFGEGDQRNISRKIDGKQTNNAAELSAIIETFHIIKHDTVNGKLVTIVSDSEYAIKCVTSYGEKCYNKGWKLDIPNKELVQIAYELFKDNPNVRFLHVRAHTNNNDEHSIGNYHADRLANLSVGLGIGRT